MKPSPFAITLIAILLAVGVWSFVSPLSLMTWFMEVAPVMLGAVAIAIAYFGFGFAFTRLVCVLLALHAVILMVGGKYTYAENPLFEWIKEALGLARNHYDRLGHFAQGFIPAMVAREVLLRTSPLKAGKWLFYIVVSVCLAASAFYELVEWWVAVGKGAGDQEAIDFLGSPPLGQAYTQTLWSWMSRLHDRAIAKRRGIVDSN